MQVNIRMKKDTQKEVADGDKKDGRLQLFDTVQVLEHSPSRVQGMSLEEENRRRVEGVEFIFKTGKVLRAQTAVMATASVYFHHFYMTFAFSQFKYWEIAGSCLFLALKIEESKQDVKHVARICWNEFNRKDIDPESRIFKEFCTKILDDELLLLQAVQFNLRPKLPYSICLSILNGPHTPLQSIAKDVRKKLAQFTWWFINSSLKSTLCLTASPLEISIACLQAAADMPEIMELDQTLAMKEKDMWWESFDPNFTKERYSQLADQFIGMIEEELRNRLPKEKRTIERDEESDSKRIKSQ